MVDPAQHVMCNRYGLVEDSEDSDEELLSSEEETMSDMPAGKRPAKGQRTSHGPDLHQIDEDAAMDAGGQREHCTWHAAT